MLARHPVLALSRIALTVRAIASDNETAIHQGSELPPQRRRRHPVSTQTQLLVRRENNQVLARKNRLRDGRSVVHQHGQRPLRHQPAPLRYKPPGRRSTCELLFLPALLWQPLGLPHGRASAAAAQRASSFDVVPCLCLTRAQKFARQTGVRAQRHD
jgi:hypothetical protein